MADLFLDYVWLGPLVWAVLYISDYCFTLTCARLYQAGAREKMAFEGSLEITPFYQKDVDALRRVSPRFILMLVISVIWLWWVAQTTAQTSPNFYAFILGALILVELAVHTRHVRNYVLFRAMLTDAVRGRLEYSRIMLLRASSTDLFTFAATFGVMAILPRARSRGAARLVRRGSACNTAGWRRRRAELVASRNTRSRSRPLLRHLSGRAHALPNNPPRP